MGASELVERLRSEVEDICTSLNDGGFTIDYRPLSVFYGDDDSSFLLCWRKEPALGYMMKNFSCSGSPKALQIYSEILENRDFVLQLRDGSIFQIEYTIDDEGIVRHRLCYLPCPLVFEDDEIASFPFSEILEMYERESLIDIVQYLSYARFDYDREFNDEKHANCHATLGSRHCRIPVFGPLTPSNFFHYVFKAYYDGDGIEDFVNSLRPTIFEPCLKSRHGNMVYFQSTETLPAI